MSATHAPIRVVHRRGTRRCARFYHGAMAAAFVVAAFYPTRSSAQWLTSPSPHFGASAIPSDDVASYLGLSLDRFTPNGKPSDPGNYNGIDRTLAFNFVAYSVASRSTRWPSLIQRATVQLGWAHDQPTEWIQNHLHLLADLAPVMSVNPRNNVLDAALAMEIVQWGSLGSEARRFVGGGFSAGTPHTESWLQLGIVSTPAGGRPGASGMFRVGAPLLGGAFPDSTLVSVYAAVEVTVELPLGRWVGMARLPSAFIAARQDTGFFADGSGNGIAERTGSIGLIGANGGWRFEAWNEYFGGRFKDKGPTGGGRLTFRVPRVDLPSWWP